MATALTLIEGSNADAGIRGRLQDVDDIAYSNNLLLDFINDGCYEFAATTGCCQYTNNITTDGTSSSYSLTTTNLTYRYVNVYGVEYNGVALDFAPNYEAIKWLTPSGTSAPKGWSVWGDTLYLDTIPPKTQTLTVYYTYIPNALTATSDVVGIPEKWHTALKAYAEYRVRCVDREDGLSARALAEYMSMRQSAAQLNSAFLMGGGYS